MGGEFREARGEVRETKRDDVVASDGGEEEH